MKNITIPPGVDDDDDDDDDDVDDAVMTQH